MLLRLFAPFMPYVTEEVWSWWREGSIHRATWPNAQEMILSSVVGTEPTLLRIVGVALSQVRGAKSTAQVSMRTPVSRAVIRGTSVDLDMLKLAVDDLATTGSIAEVSFEPSEGGELVVDVTF